MAHLIINNLSKSFNSTSVIKDISFKVKEGEFCILLGPSGCGKTTVLRLIAGLEQQDSGEIFIGDNEVSNLTPKERDIAMVFQSYALYPHMNVSENMSFSLKMQKRPKDEIENKVEELSGPILSEFGIKLIVVETLITYPIKEMSNPSAILGGSAVK